MVKSYQCTIFELTIIKKVNKAVDALSQYSQRNIEEGTIF